MTLLQFLLLAALGLLLLIAIVTDLASRTIANRLNLAVALLGVGWWMASGFSPAAVGVQIGAALAMLLLFGAAFAIGAMGGGDVKLIVALGLWLPPLLLVKMLIVMSLGGGALTLALVVIKLARQSRGRIEVPYGVAISGAALMIMANDILTIHHA